MLLLSRILTNFFSVKRSLIRYAFLLVVVCLQFTYAQNETDYWYFGKNAGLSFSNGDFTVLEDGATIAPAGCSSISDQNGNLLLYTNGQTIWNKNHQIMTNGADLAGEIQGVQTSIIIPKPNDPSTYYVFYARETTTSSPIYLLTGIYYSEVKFDVLNPLGYVTSNKDVRVAEVEATSRIAAIYHTQSETIRVICITKPDPVFGYIIPDGEFVFRIFNVTESGVNITPVIRTINDSIGRIGAMKVSPDGTYLAFADSANQKIYFYQYNNDTISFTPYYTMLTIPAFGVFLNPYGLEFSQDSKLFYYTGGDYVVQFPYREMGGMEPADYYLLTAPNAKSIQLARNGKIYVVQGDINAPITHMAVINKPEKKEDACNFRAGSINFDDATVTNGLPIFVASFLRSRIITSDDDCVDVAFHFELDAYRNITSVDWDFGDGVTSTSFTPTHLFSTPGIHKVKARIVMDNGQQVALYKDVVAYPLPGLNPNQILSQCDTDGDNISVFNLKNIKDHTDDVNGDYTYTFYHTLADANNETNQIVNYQQYTNVSNPEEIFVKIVSTKGCVTITNFFIENYQANTLPIRPMYVCESSDSILNNSEGKFNIGTKELDIRTELAIPPGFTVTLYTSLINAQTKIDPLDKYYIGPTTVIWVRIEDDSHNCFGVMPFNAIVNANIQPNIESQYTICDPSVQSPITLDGGAIMDNWQWKNQSGAVISTQRYFTLTQAGSYSLTVFKTENGLTCSESKKFTVRTVTIPVIETLKAEDGEIFVSIDGESDYQFSLNGINYYGSGKDYTFTHVVAGIHEVYIRDVNNCEKSLTASIHMLNIPKYFSPNDDGINDTWKLAGLTRTFYANADIQIYDRYGKILCRMDMEQNMNGWYGNYENRKAPATDYWYKVTLTDNNNNIIVKRGHFSLIR